MKINHLLVLTLTLIAILSCSKNEEEFVENTKITLNFSHAWEDTEITSEDFNDIKFVNENFDRLSVERLRYVISDIVIQNDNGTTSEVADYLFIDAEDESSLSFSLENLLPDGTYDLVFRFGFSDEDNIDQAYEDLNTAIFNVPEMLGGGYHYMQFDGKYIDDTDNENNFNYHAIRAIDMSDSENIVTEDTSFEVEAGEFIIDNKAATIKLQMDLSEWFKNPNLWDLNVYNQGLMMNFEAQKLMSENGQSVFDIVNDTD